jgi:pimeloyl-ACP methyl ester carboxylesterase
MVMLLALILAGIVLFALFYRVRGQVFDSNGVPIHFTDEGQGVPIILIHGFAVQSDLQWRWPGCVRKLRQRGYRVIMMDVRGHGLSGKPYNPEAYGEELCDDIVRLMDHLGIEKAHLAGYSMGGFITLKTIARHPDRLLSGVICAAGWGELDENNTALFKEIVSGIEDHQVFDAITNWVDAKKHAPKLQCALANFFMRSMNDLKAIVNVFRTFDNLVVEEEALRKNGVPALTLVGTRDGIREASDRLPGVMATHKIEYIPGGDHLSTVLKPQFMRGMLAFLDAHSQA